jgi:bacteriocin biosynthesis cyclodehydratase domain-containing protein
VSERDDRDPRAPRGRRVGVLEGQLTGAYRLRPSVELFPATDGTVYVLRPGEPDLALRDLDAVARTVLGALGPTPVRAAELPAGAAGVLAALETAGVVVAGDPDADAPSARHERQEPYLAALGLSQRRLGDACVVVLGCGGLGTWAIAAFAALGIGRLVVADDDTVELGNLNRQVLYTHADVGERKVDCAARWVRAFDPGLTVVAHPVRVRGPREVEPLLDGADALVQAADWPPYELNRWVNAACLEHRVPFITAGQMPPLLRIGPFYLPGRTACFTCHERRLRGSSALYDELVRHRQERANEPAVTLAPSSGLIGTMVAGEVLHLLADPAMVATAGRAMLLDIRTLEHRWEAVRRDPSCPACDHLGDDGSATADVDAGQGPRASDAPADPADPQ